jgi:SAM-dependent methyltransferase
MEATHIRETTLLLFESAMGRIGSGHAARTAVAVYLFDFLDRLRIDRFPQDWQGRLENELSALLDACATMPRFFEWSANDFTAWNQAPGAGTAVEETTGEVYFQLWKDFRKEEYHKQATAYLEERLAKNGITLKGVMHALDDGCGGGRYTQALHRLGCARVTGIDVSVNAVAFARNMNTFPEYEVDFQHGSVLDLPFGDAQFDFVFSNGVLHHTTSTEKGLAEIHRVLKTGGRCWLYLYGGKESLFWDIVDCARKLLADVPQAYVQAFMKVLGYPPGRIFHRTDFFYVPLNRRYFAAEVETMVREIGFKKYNRLTRGIGYDWDEIIHENPGIDPYIYGEGEMRFLLGK